MSGRLRAGPDGVERNPQTMDSRARRCPTRPVSFQTNTPNLVERHLAMCPDQQRPDVDVRPEAGTAPTFPDWRDRQTKCEFSHHAALRRARDPRRTRRVPSLAYRSGQSSWPFTPRPKRIARSPDATGCRRACETDCFETPASIASVESVCPRFQINARMSVGCMRVSKTEQTTLDRSVLDTCQV